MDAWLKALVAAACIAILAGVGYYFYSEARLAAEKTARTERIEGARRELFGLAKAKAHEVDKVRDFCGFLVSPKFTGDKDVFYRQVVVNCRNLGYL